MKRSEAIKILNDALKDHVYGEALMHVIENKIGMSPPHVFSYNQPGRKDILLVDELGKIHSVQKWEQEDEEKKTTQKTGD